MRGGKMSKEFARLEPITYPEGVDPATLCGAPPGPAEDRPPPAPEAGASVWQRGPHGMKACGHRVGKASTDALGKVVTSRGGPEVAVCQL
eukprot:gene11618-10075_t